MCNPCYKVYQAQGYLRNHERARACQAKYVKSHKAEKRAYDHEYVQEKMKDPEWVAKRREYEVEYKTRPEVREHCNKRSCTWRQSPQGKALYRRLLASPKRKLVQRLRARVYQALRGKTKSASTMTLIGCGLEHLKKHLLATATANGNGAW